MVLPTPLSPKQEIPNLQDPQPVVFKIEMRKSLTADTMIKVEGQEDAQDDDPEDFTFEVDQIKTGELSENCQIPTTDPGQDASLSDPTVSDPTVSDPAQEEVEDGIKSNEYNSRVQKKEIDLVDLGEATDISFILNEKSESLPKIFEEVDDMSKKELKESNDSSVPQDTTPSTNNSNNRSGNLSVADQAKSQTVESKSNISLVSSPGKTLSKNSDKTVLKAIEYAKRLKLFQKKVFKCALCDVTFASGCLLDDHVKTDHPNTRPFICPDCGKDFATGKSLKVHEKLHAGVRPFSCDKCNKTFMTTVHLRKHQIVHEPGKAFSCDECGKKFRFPDSLRRHQKIHGPVLNTCTKCNKNFFSKEIWESHQATHDSSEEEEEVRSAPTTESRKEDTFTCHICGKQLKSKPVLKEHIRIHTGEKPYECEICGKRYPRVGSYRKHVRIHTGIKPFSCEICGKSFVDKVHLARHFRVHTSQKPYKCQECDKSFRHHSSYNRHRNLHGDSKFLCQICGKKLTSEINLRNHTASHKTQGINFGLPKSEHKKIIKAEMICETCGYRTRNPTLFKRHKLVHTGELPYKCEVCRKGFLAKGNLKHHMAIHSDEKPFKCTICNRGFKSKYYLKRHKNTHSLHAPYQCSYCKKSFKCKSYLNRHMKGHNIDMEGHESKPHVCNVCQKAFTIRSKLDKHYVIHTANRIKYQCDICNKKVHALKSLKKHKEICHERPRFCKDCGIPFTKLNRYKHHMETYGHIKPHYHCQKCLKIFTDLASLTSHECKPKLPLLPCPHCSAMLLGKFSLRRHIRNSHKEIPVPSKQKQPRKNFIDREAVKKSDKYAGREKHPCHFCPVVVLSSRSLIRHMKNKHQNLHNITSARTQPRKFVSEPSWTSTGSTSKSTQRLSTIENSDLVWTPFST